MQYDWLRCSLLQMMQYDWLRCYLLQMMQYDWLCCYLFGFHVYFHWLLPTINMRNTRSQFRMFAEKSHHAVRVCSKFISYSDVINASVGPCPNCQIDACYVINILNSSVPEISSISHHLHSTPTSGSV